jgi:hypothetical protein
MTTDTTSGARRASTVNDDAARLGHEAARVAKEQASAVWSDAKQTARAKVAEHQQAAAQDLGGVAAALHTAAHQLGDQQQAGVARLTETAAKELEQLAVALRSKDVDAVWRDAEALARRQPVAFFAAAVAAGFVAVRFLKSSETGSSQGDDDLAAFDRSI